METSPPSLAQLIAGIEAGLRARAEYQSGKAHWAAPVEVWHALILAILVRIFGRLADLCAKWEAGLLAPPPAPAPRPHRAAARQHSVRRPQAAIAWPRTRTLPSAWDVPLDEPTPEPSGAAIVSPLAPTWHAPVARPRGQGAFPRFRLHLLPRTGPLRKTGFASRRPFAP